tara:strand:- start:1986 stop:2447 length:462 start_codon:yes stop_codon:yes gene_type:complete
MGPENRLKDTFYAYVDYFNPEKRVISQFIISDSILIYPDISQQELQTIYQGSWVNDDLSDKDSYPQKFVLDNLVDDESLRIVVKFFDSEEKKDSSGVLKRYTKSEITSVEKGVELSKRSYISYYTLLAIFLLIMVPVSMLTRSLLKKRRLQED